jgi:hypothetical protein
MTKQETERLAKMEEKAGNIEKMIEKIEAKLDRNYEVMLARVDKMEHSFDKTFVTRSELRITQWFIGIAISITVLAITVVDKIRTH